MVLSMTDRVTWVDWLTWAGLFMGVCLLLWSLGSTPDKQRGWQSLATWLRSRDRTDPLATYRFRRRHTGPRNGPANQPPTLESLREAAESATTWVPRSSVPDRPPRPSRKSS